MAWVATRVWVTGELGTAALLNTYLSGNDDALHDLFSTASQVQPARAFDTVYQNGTKIRVVHLGILNSGTPGNRQEIAYVQVGAASPPATAINSLCVTNPDAVGGAMNWTAWGSSYIGDHVTFIVLPSYYYRLVKQTGAPVLDAWTEWDLH